MKRKFSITFATSAIEDLEEMSAWYGEQQASEAGERLLSEMVSSMTRLADFPESGRIVPDFSIPELREIIHPPFRIVYRTSKDRVQIVRVWRTERLLKLPK